MADDPQNDSPKSDQVEVKEDADTAAARKELRHTVISEERKPASSEAGDTGRTTPDAPQDADTIDQIASPKKKRAREDDGAIDTEDLDAQSVASTDSAKDRASRLEPEKKRHRDTTEAAATSEDTTAAAEKMADDVAPKSLDTTHRPAEEKDKTKATTTSASAFATSGFAKLASSSASPFGAAASGKPSVFGGSASTASPFASASPQKPAAAPSMPTLSFGSQASASPFATAKPSSNGFGSAFGGFGSALGSKPLSSFAKPGESFKSEKPAKPFGAPESDAEEDEDEDGEDEAGSHDEKDAKEESDKEEAKAADEKKKKLQKVALDDGEAGETTVLAVRAKLYFLEKEQGWKERGSGMLKINVPESCVSYEDGVPVPGTFDASELDSEEGADEEEGETKRKVVRLIMRQDSTHRMLLNTVVLPALHFQEKTTLKAVGIVFTAFEGDGKPVSVQAKMSAQSAKSFMNEISLIQRELSGN